MMLGRGRPFYPTKEWRTLRKQLGKSFSTTPPGGNGGKSDDGRNKGKSSKAGTKKASTFASSLHLPKTSFPLRPPAERQKDAEIVHRITTEAYNLQQRQGNPNGRFSLLDGPPFANGQLHAGHFLNKILKDTMNRFQVTRGKRVHYIPGWDCHGLPIELLSMKNCATSPQQMTSVDVRQRCKSFAKQAMESQARDFQSWGVLANWDSSKLYSTMNPAFESKETTVLSKLLERNLIHRGLKPVHWSPTSRTALAEAELEYRDDHKSLSIYCKFPEVTGVEAFSNLSGPVAILIWTTTPWSLTGNMAIAVKLDADYVVVHSPNGEMLVMAEERMDDLRKHINVESFEVRFRLKGRDLIGGTCTSPLLGTRVPVIHGKHVTTDSGTGLVHIAPMHGVEDWECFHEAVDVKETPLECKVDDAGMFRLMTKHKDALEGKRALFEGNESIVQLLKESGLLFGEMKPYVHRYPYDWRTKSPVMTRATKQFFIRIGDEVESSAREAIESTVEKFIPATHSKKRLLATLGTRKEWCISRQRCWGLPIPYYIRGNDDNEVLLTRETIENFSRQCLARKEGADFWFEVVQEEKDDPVLPEKERGKGWRRGRDTLDVWFDSGSSWFASETQRDFETVDDLVIEGSDQHRGWFQSSLLTKVAVTGKPVAPFRALMTHGFVLDEHGQKMSKSLGNIVTPKEAMDKYGGVDVLRLWACLGDATNGDVHLGAQSLQGSQDAYKKLRNMMRFLLSCSEDRSDHMDIKNFSLMDRFMLHHLKATCDESIAGYDSYQVRQGIKPVLQFLQDEPLTIYLEQSKDKLYCDRKSSTQRRQTVYVFRQMFDRLTALLSPVCVFTADELLEHDVPAQGVRKQLVELRNENPPSEWTLSADEQIMFAILLRIRHELNKFGLKDDRRNSAKVRVVVKDSAKLGLLKQLNAFEHDNQQWSPMAQVLQVLEVDLADSREAIIGDDEFKLSVVEDHPVQRCERCRKYHKSVKITQCGGEAVPVCSRCHEAHDAKGL